MKLTALQQRLLDDIVNCEWDGIKATGPHRIRTARALEAKGLVYPIYEYQDMTMKTEEKSCGFHRTPIWALTELGEANRMDL